MKFRTKLIFAFASIVFVISSFYFAYFSYRLSNALEGKMVDLGLSLTKSLAYSSELAVMSCDSTFLISVIHGIKETEDILFVAVYAKNGAIISSEEKTAILEEALPGDLLLAAQEPGDFYQEKKQTESGEVYYDFVVPVIPSGALSYLGEGEPDGAAGFARVGLSLKYIEEEKRITVLGGVTTSVIITVVGLVCGVILAERITNPLKKLGLGAEKIGEGRLDYRVKIKTRDELEDLANSFNQMAINLEISNRNLKKLNADLEESKRSLEIKVRERTTALRELTGQLEEKVKQRTQELEKNKEELQERVIQLEKFHKVTVGRELKMIELKQKLKGFKEGA